MQQHLTAKRLALGKINHKSLRVRDLRWHDELLQRIWNDRTIEYISLSFGEFSRDTIPHIQADNENNTTRIEPLLGVFAPDRGQRTLLPCMIR